MRYRLSDPYVLSSEYGRLTRLHVDQSVNDDKGLRIDESHQSVT
jgi:hypothetical protein